MLKLINKAIDLHYFHKPLSLHLGISLTSSFISHFHSSQKSAPFHLISLSRYFFLNIFPPPCFHFFFLSIGFLNCKPFMYWVSLHATALWKKASNWFKGWNHIHRYPVCLFGISCLHLVLLFKHITLNYSSNSFSEYFIFNTLCS